MSQERLSPNLSGTAASASYQVDLPELPQGGVAEAEEFAVEGDESARRVRSLWGAEALAKTIVEIACTAKCERLRISPPVPNPETVVHHSACHQVAFARASIHPR